MTQLTRDYPDLTSIDYCRNCELACAGPCESCPLVAAETDTCPRCGGETDIPGHVCAACDAVLDGRPGGW